MSEKLEDGDILTARQLALLAAIQDRLIPAQDEMPAAGSVGCAGTVDRFLNERPALRRPIFAALSAVEAAAGRCAQAMAEDEADVTHVAFLALSGTERDAVLSAVEAAHPDVFKELLHQTYTAYYTNPAVLLILGWNPPQPEGFPTPPPFDEALLENVKQRGKLWRDA